jgi:hypothetical protein
MLFLIEYDRPTGRIVTFKTFDNSEKREAEDARLGLELELNRRGIKHEVVILGAASEEAVRRTIAATLRIWLNSQNSLCSEDKEATANLSLLCPFPFYLAGRNSGIEISGVASSNVTSTGMPIFISSGLHSTILVSIRTPSSSSTYAMM